ncbi:MAG: hypothetical protein ACYC6P_13660, partial [Ignavibacteriaceae bacterium]
HTVPKDIMLGEFGDNDIVSRLGVPFFTVNQNPYIMGKSSVDLLIRIIEQQGTHDNFNDIIVDSEILKR